MKPNINYEDDMRHQVSDKSLTTLKKVMYSQDDYGFDKYKKPLNSGMNYDWLQMALEEEADKLKYLQCEMERKQLVIYYLEMGLESDDPKIFIKKALEFLKVEGTGK